jgi:UDP-N-acetylglucosamine acyltransferase
VAADIHPTAVVHPKAELADGVRVGPFVTIGENVRVGTGTVIEARASIEGWSTLGENCHVFQGACIGTPPQDLKHEECRSYIVIGSRTSVREYVTIHPGTGPEESTEVGDDCLLMAYSHVAHNCSLGDEVILANAANLAGHIMVESRAIIGGVVGVHQFVRIGYGSFIGGCSAVRQDILPFVRAAGNPCRPAGLNTVGLRRRGLSPESIRDLERAYRIVFHSGLGVDQAAARLQEEFPETEEVGRLVDFLGQADRGLARPAKGRDE